MVIWREVFKRWVSRTEPRLPEAPTRATRSMGKSDDILMVALSGGKDEFLDVVSAAC